MGDRRNFKGKVLACETGNLTLEIDNQTHVLAIANIEKGNLVPSFD
jgi:ribosome maturation factor RimP